MCLSIALTLSIASLHLTHDGLGELEKYNESNPGVAVECTISDHWRASIGAYHNSLYTISKHAGFLLTTDNRKDLFAGVHFGVVDGYRDSVVPAARAIIQYKGVRLGYIPPVELESGWKVDSVVSLEYSITF